MPLNINTLALLPVPRFISNAIVVNTDVSNVGDVRPRLIEVRLQDFDGPLITATLYQFPATIKVGDKVEIRTDNSGTSMATVVGGGDGARFVASMVWPSAEWESDRTYFANDTARQNAWTGVANKETTDPIEPQEIDFTSALLPEVPAWIITGVVNTVFTGLQITNVTSLFTIGGYRVWIQDISGNTTYRVVIRNLNTGIDSISQEFSGSIASSVGWLTIQNTSVPFLSPGNQYQFLLFSEQHSATTTVVGGWTYTENNQDDLPPSGEAHRQSNRQTIRFNYLDDVAGDREAELLSVLPGTRLTSTNGADYDIIGITDDNSNSNVIYEVEGTNPTTGLQTFTFTIPTPLSVDYVSLTGHWASNPLTGALAKGIKVEGTGAELVNDDAYGFDLVDIRELEPSPDWDLLALSFFGGSSGGATPPPASLENGENHIINSAFDMHQLGTSIPAADDNEPIADVWFAKLENDGDADYNVITAASPPGTTKFNRITLQTADVSFGLIQYWDHLKTKPFHNQTITLSAEIRAPLQNEMGFVILGWEGTLNEPTDPVLSWPASGLPTFSTDWIVISSFTGSPPSGGFELLSTTGSVPDTVNNLAFFILSTEGTIISPSLVDFTAVKVEIGLTPTPHIPEPFEFTQQQCFYHLYVLEGVNHYICSTYGLGNDRVRGHLLFPVNMRENPSIVFSGQNIIAERAGNSGVGDGGEAATTSVSIAGLVLDSTAALLTVDSGLARALNKEVGFFRLLSGRIVVNSLLEVI